VRALALVGVAGLSCSDNRSGLPADSGLQPGDSGMSIADSGSASSADSGMSTVDSGPASGADSGMSTADAMVADSGGAPDTGTMMGGLVPDPGTMAASFDWLDIEPDDTPAEAVPRGILNSGVWFGTGNPASEISKINNDTDVDWYVFRTPADAPTRDMISIQVCSATNTHVFDLYLYNVVNQMQGSLVTSATSNSGCQTLIPAGMASHFLDLDKVYLLEVAATPGLHLNGADGTYQA
jgi:hypothetical protein